MRLYETIRETIHCLLLIQLVLFFDYEIIEEDDIILITDPEILDN